MTMSSTPYVLCLSVILGLISIMTYAYLINNLKRFDKETWERLGCPGFFKRRSFREEWGLILFIVARRYVASNHLRIIVPGYIVLACWATLWVLIVYLVLTGGGGMSFRT